jgi:hypothetical protein
MKTGTVKIEMHAYEWWWALYDTNNDLVVMSDTGYSRPSDAVRGWERFKRLVAGAKVEKAK